MKGRRVQSDANGWLTASFEPGDYGVCAPKNMADGTPLEQPWPTYWQVMAPNGHMCSLNPSVHTITEHPDGTITVHPSILIKDGNGNELWHGHLEAGVFR